MCITLLQAKQLSQRTQSTLDKITSVVLKKVKKDEEPVIVESEKISLYLQKLSAKNLGSKNIQGKEGAITLPDNFGAQDSNEAVSLQVSAFLFPLQYIVNKYL